MNTWQTVLFWIWAIGDTATFIYLTFFDGFNYNGWNWLIAIPINFFLSTIWPIYWAILRPLNAWISG